jgi:dTDP-4-amino-4,6-dideoxygalactose transaminase
MMQTATMSDGRIPLCEPCIGGNASRYIQECLETNFVSSVGPFVNRFEREFAAFVGSPFAVACASGTAAIHLALIVAGVRPGDEVFVSDFTFIATVNPITYLGGRPVLVDADAATWNMDPDLLKKELDRRNSGGLPMPRAILVAHVLGIPANLSPIREICDRYGITLIEDAAEALGAGYKDGPLNGRQVGTVGRLGCYSFNGNKIITTGGGGMVVTEDEKLAQKVRHLSVQARMPGPDYFHDEVGYNYRMTNLSAALGVAQLEQLPSFLGRKKEIAERYDRGLGNIRGITLPPRPSWAAPTFWLYSILLEPSLAGIDKSRLRDILNEGNVVTRSIWTPIHMMEFYDGLPTLGGKTGERLFDLGLSLPSSVSLSEERQDAVIGKIVSCLNR